MRLALQSLVRDSNLPTAALEAGQAFPAAARFFALSRDLGCALAPACNISGVHSIRLVSLALTVRTPRCYPSSRFGKLGLTSSI